MMWMGYTLVHDDDDDDVCMPCIKSRDTMVMMDGWMDI